MVDNVKFFLYFFGGGGGEIFFNKTIYKKFKMRNTHRFLDPREDLLKNILRKGGH